MSSARVLYADTDLAVVVKYAGEVCELPSAAAAHSADRPAAESPAAAEAPCLVDVVRPEIEAALGSPVPFCGCVHRLDLPVSGLCVLALNRDCAALLSAQFANRDSVEKTYLAVTELKKNGDDSVHSGTPSPETLLSCHMIFDPKARKARIVAETTRKAKKAELAYRIAGTGERYSFVTVRLLTGRTHQIRCQLAAEGMPVKGDVKYGARRSDPLGGIRLHAYRLRFTHPVTGKRCDFTAPPPVVDTLWQACLDAAAQSAETQSAEALPACTQPACTQPACAQPAPKRRRQARGADE